MSNDMKCPFCGRELKISGHELHDLDLYCDKCEPFMVGNKELWQELIRTRKALEIAVDALKDYEDRDFCDCNGNWCGCELSTAHEALNEITALEQKDNK